MLLLVLDARNHGGRCKMVNEIAGS